MTLRPSPLQPWALLWRQQPRRTRQLLLLQLQQVQRLLTQQEVLQAKQPLELFPMSALELYPEQRLPALEPSLERQLPAPGRVALEQCRARPPALGQSLARLPALEQCRARPPALGQSLARPPALEQCRAWPPALGRCQARPPALVQCLVQLLVPVLGSEGNLTQMPGLGLPAPAPQEDRSLKPEQQTPTQGWQVDRARARACT